MPYEYRNVVITPAPTEPSSSVAGERRFVEMHVVTSEVYNALLRSSEESTTHVTTDPEWNKFAAREHLLKVDHLMTTLPETARAFTDFADGFGSPGLFPSGYDWSGIRDSSTNVQIAFNTVANLLGKHFKVEWPWRSSEVSAFVKVRATSAKKAKNAKPKAKKESEAA